MTREVVPPREESNPLCARCIRTCRQPLAVRLLECPRFKPFPFKITAPPEQQLGLFDEPEPPRKAGKKKEK